MPKKYKTTALERKSIGISSGANTTNKVQLKKISKVDTSIPKEQVPLSELYMYVNKKWQHKGTCCRLCGTLMSNNIVIDKHRYVCEILNKNKENIDAGTDD